MPTTTLRSVSQVAAARHSCRAFTDRQVEPSLVRSLLEVAQRAPSWCNVQPWQVHITAGDLPGGARWRRRESGFALYESLAIARDDTSARLEQAWRNFTFFDAPHVAVLSVDKDLGPYALLDAGVWLSHFLLAATEAGVATIAQAAIASYSSLVREFFELPEQRHVVCAISFGYADEIHPVNSFRTTRADLSDVVDAKGLASWQ